MGSTAVHDLPYPEPNDTANGPAAFKALAEKVEQKMTTYLGVGASFTPKPPEESFPGIAVPPGESRVLWDGSFSSYINGWMAMQVDLMLYVNESGSLPDRNARFMPAGAPWAGVINTYVDTGRLWHTYRFHSFGLTSWLNPQYTVNIPHVGSATPHKVKLELLTDAPSVGWVYCPAVRLRSGMSGAYDDSTPAGP